MLSCCKKQIKNRKKNMKEKTIVSIMSHLEMVGFIKANGTECRFVSLVSETEPKLRAGCPYKGVLKVARRRGLLNVNFNTSVRKHLAEKMGVEVKDVEYENGEVWYRHVLTADGKPLPLCVNKKVALPDADTEYYMQFFPRSSDTIYRMPDGRLISEAELQPFFYKQSERDNFKPIVISIKVSNIKELRASGVIMQAEDIAEAEAALTQAI